MLLCHSGLCKKTISTWHINIDGGLLSVVVGVIVAYVFSCMGSRRIADSHKWRWRVLFFQCRTDRGYKQGCPRRARPDLDTWVGKWSGETPPYCPSGATWLEPALTVAASGTWLITTWTCIWIPHKTHVYCSFRFGFLNHCRHFIHFAVWYNYTFN